MAAPGGEDKDVNAFPATRCAVSPRAAPRRSMSHLPPRPHERQALLVAMNAAARDGPALHHRHLARGSGRAISLRALQGVESRTAAGSACWRRRCYRCHAAVSRVEASGIGEDGEGELLL